MTPEQLERTYKLVEQAAIEGRRCPQNDAEGVTAGGIPALARAGRIKVAISTHNWRTVTILMGPHRGKTTLQDPSGRKPWKILDKNGTHWGGRTRQAGDASHTQPYNPAVGRGS